MKKEKVSLNFLYDTLQLLLAPGTDVYTTVYQGCACNPVVLVKFFLPKEVRMEPLKWYQKLFGGGVVEINGFITAGPNTKAKWIPCTVFVRNPCFMFPPEQPVTLAFGGPNTVEVHPT